MLKFIQTRVEDYQRWRQIQNSKLSPRQHTTGFRGIHAIWEMALWCEGVELILISVDLNRGQFHKHLLRVVRWLL